MQTLYMFLLLSHSILFDAHLPRLLFIVQIFEHPLARPLVPHLPPQIQQLLQSQPARVIIDDYDSARVYLAKWAAFAQSDSERNMPRDSVLRRPRIHGPIGGLTQEQQEQEVGGWEEETRVGWFEVIDVSDSGYWYWNGRVAERNGTLMLPCS